MDQLLERQKIVEDKVTRLENEIHASQHFITEQEFIEVSNNIKIFAELQ